MPATHCRSITMAELARELKLARSTVSMALRRHPEIAKATRDRVAEAAKRLGYRPNPLVAALMANLQQKRPAAAGSVIAVIDQHASSVDWRSMPLLDQLWSGVEARARQLGFALQGFKLGRGALTPARLATVLRTRGIRGAVMAPLPQTGPSLVEKWDDLAVATMNWSIAAPAMHRSAAHYFHNVGLAWDQLRARGYRRIGFTSSRLHSERVGHAYLGGFLARANFVPARERTAPLLGETLDELTLPVLRDWQRRERLDAVIFAEPGYLAVRMEALRAAAGGRLGLVSLELGWSPPHFAGIEERSPMIGSGAFDLVVNQLHRNEHGLPAVPEVVHVPGVWKDGATVRG